MQKFSGADLVLTGSRIFAPDSFDLADLRNTAEVAVFGFN